MPCRKFKVSGEQYAITCCSTGTYKAGDPAPSGYNDWHEWASVQHKAGLRAQPCSFCGKWRFPQERCCDTKQEAGG